MNTSHHPACRLRLVAPLAWPRRLPSSRSASCCPTPAPIAALGMAIENGFRLYVQEQGGKLGGREIEFVKVDDESDPAKATDNVNKLVKRDNVDVLVGTVHSGVAMAMAKVGQGNRHAADRAQRRRRRRHRRRCARRTSSAARSRNWQPGYAMGEVIGQEGHKKVVTITWKYAAGDESVRGFKEALREGRRQGRQGTEPAVPERRVPGAADRDRGAPSPTRCTPSSPAAARSSSSRTTRRPA